MLRHSIDPKSTQILIIGFVLFTPKTKLPNGSGVVGIRELGSMSPSWSVQLGKQCPVPVESSSKMQIIQGHPGKGRLSHDAVYTRRDD